MSRTPLVVALAVAVPLTLAGCSGASGGSASASSTAASASAAAPASSAAAASAPASSAAASSSAGDGSVIEGTGYSYSPPEGWTVPEGVAKPEGTDTFAADTGDTDGFADNLNVIVLNTGSVTAADAEAQGPAGLKQIGAKKVDVAKRVTVQGEPAAHLAAALTSSGKKYRVDQFYLPHDGKTYVVTFSFSPDVSKADRKDVYSPVLAAWDWA